MRIDTAIHAFSEKYDREAVASIDEMSTDRGLALTGATVKAFNMKESFDMFSQYLKEYANYKVGNINNEKASPQTVIKESVSSFIGSQLFKESNVKCTDLSAFVMSYIEGINTLTEAVEEAKKVMNEGDVDPEAIGDINEFADRFMEQLHESFDPFMEKTLWATGYTSKKKLSPKRPKENKPVFL